MKFSFNATTSEERINEENEQYANFIKDKNSTVKLCFVESLPQTSVCNITEGMSVCNITEGMSVCNITEGTSVCNITESNIKKIDLNKTWEIRLNNIDHEQTTYFNRSLRPCRFR